MSQDSEKIKRMIEFREKLGKNIEKTEAELKDLHDMLETVNSILLEKGFRRADTIRETPTSQTISPEKEAALEHEESSFGPAGSPENVVPLRTASGDLLAVLHLTKNSLRALPAADKNFEINTPPFTQFLVERVLMKMQERDNELVRAGQLPPDSALSYVIVREGDVIREIYAKNVDSERLRELKSSIRWTLEKMFEKTRTQG